MNEESLKMRDLPQPPKNGRRKRGIFQHLCGFICGSKNSASDGGGTYENKGLKPGIVSGFSRRSTNRKSFRRQKSYDPPPLTEAEKQANLKLIERFKNEENEFEKRDTYLPKITNVPFYQDYNETVMLVEKRKRKIVHEVTDVNKDTSHDIKRWASEGYNKKKDFAKLPHHSLAPDAVTTFADNIAGDKGLRMRWVDMPEVKEMASSLDSNLIGLEEARFEILTSEASYYKTLKMLIENFYFSEPMTPSNEEDLVNFRINPYDKHHLFSNILNLTTQVEEFLKELEAEFHNDPMLNRICDIVFEYVQYNSKEYLTYIANQDYQSKTFEKLSKNPLFVEALTKLQSNPQCGGLKLADQLNLPMQRVLRYKLLITAVLHRTSRDHPSYKNGLICLGAIDTFIRNCIERKIDIQQKEGLLELSRKLEFKEDAKSVGLGSRKLIKEGRLRIMRLSKLDSSAFRRNFGHVLRKKAATATLLLFNDILLITKHRQNDKFLVEDICSLKSIRIERGNSPPDAEIIPYVQPKTPREAPSPKPTREESVQSIYKSAIGDKRTGSERRTSLTRNVSLSKNFRWLSENDDELNLEEGAQIPDIYPFKLFIDTDSAEPVEYEFQATSLSERERWIDALDKNIYPAYDEFELNTSNVDAPLMFCVRKAESKQIDELEVNEGDTANLLVKCSDGWMKVQIGENRIGWIQSKCLEEVLNPSERQKSIKDFYLFNSAKKAYNEYVTINHEIYTRFKKSPANSRGLTSEIKASV